MSVVFERPQTYSLDRAATEIGCVKAAVRNTEKKTLFMPTFTENSKILVKANSL